MDLKMLAVGGVLVGVVVVCLVKVLREKETETEDTSVVQYEDNNLSGVSQVRKPKVKTFMDNPYVGTSTRRNRSSSQQYVYDKLSNSDRMRVDQGYNPYGRVKNSSNFKWTKYYPN